MPRSIYLSPPLQGVDAYLQESQQFSELSEFMNNVHETGAERLRLRRQGDGGALPIARINRHLEP
ncbi:hypothetical protein DRO42_02330 [Candidatus Bathyarchaeota archaeon]|nr:MAG: hypothetical protein DRO42_02330 [Candidatus Bathyarchaeota archaeon]